MRRAKGHYEQLALDNSGDRRARDRAQAAQIRLAQIHHRLGEHAAADQTYQGLVAQLRSEPPAEDPARRARWAAQLPMALLYYAALLKDTGDHGKALRLLDESETHFKAVLDQPPESLTGEFVHHWLLSGVYSIRGEILLTQNNHAAARTAMTSTIAAIERCLQLEPTNRESQNELGGALHNLALVLVSEGDDDAALPLLERAIELQTVALDDVPTHKLALEFLAKHWRELAKIRTRRGDAPAAEAAESKAREAVERLVQVAPDAIGARTELAAGEYDRGLQLYNAGRPHEAEQHYRRAANAYEGLVILRPEQEEHRERLGRTLYNLGLAQTMQDRDKEGEATWRKALALYEELATQFPDNAAYHAQLGATRGNLAAAALSMNDPAQAKELAESAIATQARALELAPGTAEYEAHMDQHQRTLAEAEAALESQQGRDSFSATETDSKLP
jgi:tetratricopeptide (TPR) repeat protein